MKKTLFTFMLAAGLCAYANNKSSNDNDPVIKYPVVKKYKLNHADSVAMKTFSAPPSSLPPSNLTNAD